MARRNNLQVAEAARQGGQQSRFGRGILHGIAGGIAGELAGAAAAGLASHYGIAGSSHLPGSHGNAPTIHPSARFGGSHNERMMDEGARIGGALGRVMGFAHGWRSAAAHNAQHNALINQMIAGSAHRPHMQTMRSAIKNARFEAKHRRIHGRFA